MKALIYKELKLAMHPICYLFVILFPLMILIPNYPRAIGFIYILSCYPILFLGANKGQQSNDLLYSTLLPVRKKDIVLARIITVLLMQFTFIAITSCLYPLAVLISNLVPKQEDFVSIDLNGFVSLLAIGIVGYTIADMIFFPIYYKNGKSIVMSTLFTILGFVVYLITFTIVIPSIKEFSGYLNLLCYSGWGVQLIFLAISLVICVIGHIIVYKVSSKKLEHVDF